MAVRVLDPSLGVPLQVTRLGEPGMDRNATPRVGPNRCAKWNGTGAASGPQVTPGQDRRARPIHARSVQAWLTKEAWGGIPPTLLG